MGKSLFHTHAHLSFPFNEILLLLFFLFSYPSSFIDKQFRKFLYEYISLTSFLPIINDEQQFKRIRQNILKQPTSQQSQVAISAATADLDNDPTTNEEESIQATTATTTTSNNDEIKANGQKIIVHYTHEKRFHSFKRDMHHIYENTFQNQINKDIKMIVGNRNRRDAKKELIHKRPKQYLIKNKTRKGKFSITIYVIQNSINNMFVFFIHFST
jgi:hypothetical protein